MNGSWKYWGTINSLFVPNMQNVKCMRFWAIKIFIGKKIIHRHDQKRFQGPKFEVFSRCLNQSQKCFLCPERRSIPLCDSETESELWRVTSLPASHDFEVLQCIVGCVGSCGFYTWSEAMAHCDWLRGQLHQTLTQAAQTALLCHEKRWEMRNS